MNATVTPTTVTLSLPVPAPIQPTDDYGCFIYIRPNASGGQIATSVHLSAEIMTAFDVWLATQKNPDTVGSDGKAVPGTPRYPNLGNLVMTNALQTLLPVALAAHPTAEMMSAGAIAAQAQAAAQKAQIDVMATGIVQTL